MPEFAILRPAIIVSRCGMYAFEMKYCGGLDELTYNLY